jgi:hypothetical protein
MDRLPETSPHQAQAADFVPAPLDRSTPRKVYETVRDKVNDLLFVKNMRGDKYLIFTPAGSAVLLDRSRGWIPKKSENDTVTKALQRIGARIAVGTVSRLFFPLAIGVGTISSMINIPRNTFQTLQKAHHQIQSVPPSGSERITTVAKICLQTSWKLATVFLNPLTGIVVGAYLEVRGPQYTAERMATRDRFLMFMRNHVLYNPAKFEPKPLAHINKSTIDSV